MSEANQIAIVAYARHRLDEALPRLVNLSEGVAVVRTEILLDLGEPVDMTIYFVEANQEVQIKAEVVWANENLGDMALKFLRMSPVGEALVADFIAKQTWK
jgi:hypothetical protein